MNNGTAIKESKLDILKTQEEFLKQYTQAIKQAEEKGDRKEVLKLLDQKQKFINTLIDFIL